MSRKRVPQVTSGALAFGRNLLVLAVLVLGPGLWGAAQGLLTLRWPRATATIVDAKLLTHQVENARSNQPDEWKAFSVVYTYRVAGRDHVGGRVEPYDFGMQNSAGARRMQERHPIGSTVDVVYDPADPSLAYLEPGPSSVSLMLSGIGLLIGAAGLWVRHLARRGIGQMA